MSKLYTLMFGKSKKNMKPIMTDCLNRVERYKAQREATKGSKAAAGWHEIVDAPNDAVPWRKNQSSQWTNYGASGPKRV